MVPDPMILKRMKTWANDNLWTIVVKNRHSFNPLTLEEYME